MDVVVVVVVTVTLPLRRLSTKASLEVLFAMGGSLVGLAADDFGESGAEDDAVDSDVSGAVEEVAIMEVGREEAEGPTVA